MFCVHCAQCTPRSRVRVRLVFLFASSFPFRKYKVYEIYIFQRFNAFNLTHSSLVSFILSCGPRRRCAPSHMQFGMVNEGGTACACIINPICVVKMNKCIWYVSKIYERERERINVFRFVSSARTQTQCSAFQFSQIELKLCLIANSICISKWRLRLEAVWCAWIVSDKRNRKENANWDGCSR